MKATGSRACVGPLGRGGAQWLVLGLSLLLQWARAPDAAAQAPAPAAGAKRPVAASPARAASAARTVAPPALPAEPPVLLVTEPAANSTLRTIAEAGYEPWLPQPCDADERHEPPHVVCGWKVDKAGDEPKLSYQDHQSGNARAWLTVHSDTLGCDAWWARRPIGVAPESAQAIRNGFWPSAFGAQGVFIEQVEDDGEIYGKGWVCAPLGSGRLDIFYVIRRPLASTRVYQEVAWMMNQLLRSKARSSGVELPPEEPRFSVKTRAESTTASAQFKPAWLSPNEAALKVAVEARLEKNRLDREAFEARRVQAARAAAEAASQAAVAASAAASRAAAAASAAEASKVAAEALSASIQARIAPTPTGLAARDRGVYAWVNTAGRELVFLPMASTLALPGAPAATEGMSRSQSVTLKTAGLEYMLALNFDDKTCADADRAEVAWVKSSTAAQRADRDVKLVDGTPFDARWGDKHYSSAWTPGGKPRQRARRFCMDGPHVTINVSWSLADGVEFDSGLAAPFMKGLADLFGPGTAAPDTSPLAWVNGKRNPWMTPISNPKSVQDAAALCSNSSNALLSKLNCDLVASFRRQMFTCFGVGQAPNRDMAIPFCEGIAETAANDKDYEAAAVYFQRACDYGESSACRRAMDAKGRFRR